MRLVTRKWTFAEYEKLAEVGLLAENERVELILGDIVTMTPVDPIHSNAISQANTLLVEKFASTHSVRVQVPIQAGDHSEPEPDFALISKEEGMRLARERAHPKTAELVIELANTSLVYDTTVKPFIYALAQVGQYWVVDLRGEVAEVFSEVVQDPASPTGWSYAARRRHQRGQQLAFAGRSLAVDDLLTPT